MSINGTQVSSASGKYPYLSLFYALMDTQQSIDTYRTLALYKKETAGHLDETRTKTLVLDVNQLEEVTGNSSTSGQTSPSSPTGSQSGSSAGSNTRKRRASDSGDNTSRIKRAATDATSLVTAIGGSNPSMYWRAEALASGNEVTLIAKLDMDVFHLDTYLINGAALKITFKQSSPEFRIIQPPGEPLMGISLVDLTFHPFYVHLSPDLVITTEDMLSNNHTALLPFTSQHIDSYTIAPGTHVHIRYHYVFTSLKLRQNKCVTFLL
mgnify:CR=1 FL=1